ncbi:hypothetical protein F183_A02010 [Bryobacterales bacterium F-183]|nr:hypothetical protein F183_A02010 [Bryobacterales bacterium F-183]
MNRRQFLFASTAVFAQTAPSTDWRDIRNGLLIPKEGYVDQPYVVVTKDGNWLCVLTTGSGVEGEPGQHICATISTDKGRTWTPLIDIEPAGGPEASWVMPLLVPSGRVYVFYTYNKDNIRLLENVNSPAIAKRVDTMGAYAFKYSDDHGRTWSRDRHYIPLRNMRIDRGNVYQGKIQFFWGVGKPILDAKGRMFFGYAKVGKWGNPGTMVESQGCFIRSDNIATERDPAKIQFQLLPDGDEGLRAPKGPVSDEANLVSLSDGSLYATYRTIDGYNCHAYSRDGGHTWTPPAYATYSPNSPRRLKHPRAANFVRKFSNGKYLLWFHNHGGEAVHSAKWEYYQNRNPAWICGGVEKNGYIHWSEPEILLYDEDPKTRISYPDFIEDGGKFYVTETQKTIARVHEIDRKLLDGIWNESRTLTREGLLTEPTAKFGPSFTIDFRVNFRELSPGQIVFSKGGVQITTTDRFTLQIQFGDFAWDCDPGTHPGTLRVGVWQHVAVIVDAGPRIVSWVIDGVFNDGGAIRDFGWGRFPASAQSQWQGAAEIAPKIFGECKALRVYNRALRTAEVVANFRSGM